MYLFGSMPCVSIITPPSEEAEEAEEAEEGEEGEEEEEEERRGGEESFHRPRRALDITPPPTELVVVVVVEDVLGEVVAKGGKFSLVKW